MTTYQKLFNPANQARRKIITSISKQLLLKEDKEDKENRSPNKQKPFHFSRKHTTLKTESHLPKRVKKGGRRNKTQKLSRSKSKRYMK